MPPPTRRKWGKKVVFVVNKVDILASADEVAEVVDFVAANAQRLLGVEAANVMPISARAALEAKLAYSSRSHGGEWRGSVAHDMGFNQLRAWGSMQLGYCC